MPKLIQLQQDPYQAQAVAALGTAIGNAFDPDYQAQRATARIKNQLAQAEAQNALGYQQERRAAAQGMPEKFSPDEDVRQRDNERSRLQLEAENTTAQNGMMSQLAQGTPAAESQRAYGIINDLPPAPNVAAAHVAEKGTLFPGFAEEQARTQKQAMGETAQNANVGNLSSDALFSPAMKQRAESNAQLIASLEDQYKALQLQVSPLNPNQQMRISAIQQQYALKEKMAAARESQAKIGMDAQNEIATVMSKLGSDGFRQKLSAETGKSILGFGAADGNLALMIQDAPDAPPVVWKTPFQASYLDDLVKMGTKTTETNAIGETGNPLKTTTTTQPGGDAKTTVEGDAEVAGRAQKFTAGIKKEVANTNYLNAHTKGVEQQSELHGVQMDLAKEKLNQERLINSGRAKLAGGQLPTQDEYGALMAFEKQKQKQKEPKEDNLKAKDGLGVLEKHFSLDPEKLGPASAIYERYLKDGKNPMKAVSDTISMINGKTPIGRTPTVGEVIKGNQFIGGDPNDRNRWVKQGSQPPENVRQRDNERSRLQQQAITEQAALDALPNDDVGDYIRRNPGLVGDPPTPGNALPANAASAKSPSPEQIMQKKIATQEARIAELRQIIEAPTYIWHKGMAGNPKGAVLEERKMNAQKELRALLGGGGD